MVIQYGKRRDIQLNNQVKILLSNSWIELLARWLLGAIFIYASYHKFFSPAEFAKIIYGYDLLPHILINITAIVLPFVELFLGLALIIGIYPRSAALIVNIMVLSFIIAISINLIRGHEFDCGCFSIGTSASPTQILIRDIILFITGFYVLFYDRERRWCYSSN